MNTDAEHDKSVFDLLPALVIGPHTLAKSGSEHAEQRALFCWLNYLAYNWYPELRFVYAVPNGGKRGDSEQSAKIAGGMMKAEGMKKGVPDLFVPIPRFHVSHNRHYCGFYVEMKTANGGDGGSKEQHEYLAFLSDQGYATYIANGWQAAATAIREYMEFQRKS